MKTRFLSTLLTALSLSMVASACGGAVEPVGTGQPGPTPGPQPVPGPGPGPAPAPAPSPVPVPAPAPETWNPDAKGCGNFLVYRSHSTGKKFLVLQANKDELGIAHYGETTTVSLGSATKSVVVTVDAYASAPSETHYCSDIIIDPQTPTTWAATQGTAKITITGVGREGDFYAVTVELRSVVVRSPNGQLEAIPDMTLKDVGVGWLPG